MPKQLVIQLARFGDIVQTRRLVLSLRQSGEVHLCVDQAMAGLARLVYPDIPIHGLPAHGSDSGTVLREAAAIFAALQAERFDAVYALNHAGLCRALVSLFDPAIVRGYPVASGQSLRSRWVRLAFRWMARRAEAPLNLVDFWAALAPNMIPPHRVNPPACPGGEGLGVVLAGQHARRSLPPEILAPIVHAVFERLGGPRVRLLGSPAEHEAARRLRACLPASVLGKTVDLTGRTDWPALADALTGLDALLSPDTGTAHFAAHLGVPVEGLFLSSAWAFETGPYGEGHRIWQSMADCSPCTESAPCGRAVACLAPFRSVPFLARMQGRTGGAAVRPLSGMLTLRSAYDDLGQIWLAPAEEADPHHAARAALRQLLAEYLDGGKAHRPAEPTELEASPHGAFIRDYADFLYQEADWILPQSLP